MATPDAATLRLDRPRVTRAAPVVKFRFDGKEKKAIRGETVAAALAASGTAALRQTEADLSPWRGLYCGMGACFDCVVTIDGRAGQRACLARISGGEEVRSSPPSGRLDDPLMPLAVPSSREALEERATDILVIGAGPAGLAAALAARRCGAAVVVLDERPQSGGQYFKGIASSHEAAVPPDRQFRQGSALVDEVRRSGATILQEAAVFGAFAADEILALVDGEGIVFRPRRLVLATGAYERAMPIPGWTLPGVMTTGAAQTLMRAYQVAPGRRVVVAGNGPLNLQLAADMAAMGVEVVAVAESASRPGLGHASSLLRAMLCDPLRMIEGAGYLSCLRSWGLRSWGLRSWGLRSWGLRSWGLRSSGLRSSGVPILWGHLAIAAKGEGRLGEVVLAPVDAKGLPNPVRSRSLKADTLCLGYGLVASCEIANALGCRMRLDARHLGSLAVDTTDTGETSADGVFAVGDGASVAGSAVALAKGEIAGRTAAEQLGYEGGQAGGVQKRLKRAQRFQDALWTLFRAPPVLLEPLPDETIICRCETLDLGFLRREIEAGAASLAVLKRRTRLGMGRCQGRYCSSVAASLLCELTGRQRSLDDAFAPRLPAKPFPAAALAIEKPEWGGHKRAGSPNLARPVPQPPFEQVATEVAVIGAGVVGSCIAHALAKAGKDVLVIERDDANLQASGANAGSLHVQLLSFDFGAKAEAGGGPAAATLPLGPWAVALWQELAEDCGHEFEIRITGGLMVAETDSGMAFLEAKAALERRYGLEAEILSGSDLRRLAPALSPHLIGAEWSPLEGKINPLTATYAVLRRALALGARIERSSDVISIEREGAAWKIMTGRGVVRAGNVVNAAGPWARQIGAMVGLDVPVYSAPLQMIVTERAPPLVDQLVAHADRHLSLKQLASGGLVIGGAWTARYSEQQNLNATIRESIEGNLWVAGQVLPQLYGLHVIRSWAGMNVNIDGAPIVGEAPGRPGFFNAVTSNGYTLAPAIAKITADLFCRGRADRDVRPYLIDRF